MRISHFVTGPLCGLLLAAGLAACGGSGQTVTISGTVTGLTADNLVLSDAYTTVPVPNGATSFSFPSAISANTSYAVTVSTQPTGLTCTVTNGYGTASTSNITNVAVACTPNRTLSVNVTGLAVNPAQPLILTNGGDQTKPLVGNADGTPVVAAFPAKVPQGSTYGVTVLQQPTGQTCGVQGGAGYMPANDVVVDVICQNQ